MSKDENFHSTCQTCNKIIPNVHFDCERVIKETAYQVGVKDERERCVKIAQKQADDFQKDFPNGSDGETVARRISTAINEGKV